MADPKPRVRGEGWEVWLDEDRVLWTRDTSPQHAVAAAQRVAAMEQAMAGQAIRGVLVDDTKFGGGDTPTATAMYIAFVARNPGVPFAIVTTSRETLRQAADIRASARGANLQVFKTVQAARAWLVKLEGWRP